MGSKETEAPILTRCLQGKGMEQVVTTRKEWVREMPLTYSSVECGGVGECGEVVLLL